MNTFVLALGLALLFVLGGVVAMRPSPRQTQLARLRACAASHGMRVRIAAAAANSTTRSQVLYLLPWRLEDLEYARELRWQARRDDAGAWQIVDQSTALTAPCTVALAQLAVGIDQVLFADEGLAARWDERGQEADVERLAQVLAALREAGIGAAREARRNAVAN